jgi:hypothetical protein
VCNNDAETHFVLEQVETSVLAKVDAESALQILRALSPEVALCLCYHVGSPDVLEPFSECLQL